MKIELHLTILDHMLIIYHMTHVLNFHSIYGLIGCNNRLTPGCIILALNTPVLHYGYEYMALHFNGGNSKTLFSARTRGATT